MTRRAALVVASLAGLMLTGCGSGGGGFDEVAAVEKLNEHAATYAAASGELAGGRPRLAGRVVPIDMERRRVEEEIYDLLPDRVKARSPSEARTVVKIRYHEHVVGKYTSGDKAIQVDARVTIVNRGAHRRYAAKHIEGPIPDLLISSSDEASGGPPVDEVVSSLTRKYKPNQR